MRASLALNLYFASWLSLLDTGIDGGHHAKYHAIFTSKYFLPYDILSVFRNVPGAGYLDVRNRVFVTYK